MIDLDAAMERLHDLGDEQLAELVIRLDGTLAGFRESFTAIAADDVVSLAASARILLRKRREQAAVQDANDIADQFMNALGGAR